MLYTVEKNGFRLSASSLGAELSSFYDCAGDYEYIWQKNEIWNGQSPLLFPVVGKVKNDCYRFGGKEYTMPKHGFARRAEFALKEKTEDALYFELRESPETLAQYPFHFSLQVRFTILEKGFEMRHTVKNTGHEKMYFSLGAHPGFNCQMGDRIVMDEKETAHAHRLGQDALRMPDVTPVFSDSREMEITPDIFEKDALIFSHLQSSGASLIRANGRNVHVDFGGAPALGLWAKPGAPYVCIEPWYGIDDTINATGELKEKEEILCLQPGEKFEFPVAVQVL